MKKINLLIAIAMMVFCVSCDFTSSDKQGDGVQSGQAKGKGSSSDTFTVVGTPSEIPSVEGTVLYVNKATGNNRNDGSKENPIKNLQKAIDMAEAGTTIFVAEGNYFGLLDKGNIIIDKPVKLYGGFNSSFTERNILKYLTMVQPSAESNGTASGQGTIQLRSIQAPNDEVVIDGFVLDRGYSIAYNAKGESKPDGLDSPRMNPIGTAGIGGDDAFSNDNVLTTETAMIYFDGYQGVVNDVNVVVRNCTFVNLPNFAILGMMRGGSLMVENNVFVNVRMAVMDVRGASANNIVPITFEGNTVLFAWTHTRGSLNMGYGYRMIPGTSNTLRNNIFGCAVFAAIDRTHVDSDKAREAKRVEAIENNMFFLNREADLTIPGGGMFMRIRVNDFDDVEEIDKVSGNKTITDPSVFKDRINAAYLKGFMDLTMSTEVSVDYNSDANQFREAFGMNPVGTATSNVSMYANRYPWRDALKLFGAMNGYGAQMPK